MKLDWFNGYLHTDAGNVFTRIGNHVAIVNCNAHARRKFEAIAQGKKQELLKKLCNIIKHYIK